MIQANRIALAAVPSVRERGAVGALGIMVIVAACRPDAGTHGRSRPEAADPEQPVETVAMSVPDGMLAKSLTIIDASGRELATLTHWRNGETMVVTREQRWARGELLAQQQGPRRP